jgi:hypothetical protein
MAQSIEVTELENNGTINKTPVTKSLNVLYIESIGETRDNLNSEIFMSGKSTKDFRVCLETQAALVLLANAAPTADIVRVLDLTVVNKVGNLPRETYKKAINKYEVVEFYADTQEPTNTVVIVQETENNAERSVYIVDEDYSTVKGLNCK